MCLSEAEEAAARLDRIIDRHTKPAPELPAEWTREEIEKLQRTPHDVRLARRLGMKDPTS